MSIFTQDFDPITGHSIWKEQDLNYDYHQEVARSAFADMLHDHERNEKYYMALKKAIEHKHRKGEQAHVLDIGTGTGLLSMMAAKCGADTITACEAFRPMADCAIKIIIKNGYESRIDLVRKRSTEMTVGTKGDMSQRANILVTEVFDTELIGEGALATFKHAHQILLEKNAIIIPHSGKVWTQVIDSNIVKAWNRIFPIKDPNSCKILIEAPAEVNSCSGSSAVHDIQLSQLSSDAFTPLTKPQQLFTFDWSTSDSLVFNESKISQSPAIATGIAHAVFMWWELIMDQDNEIILSCAPVWEHPDVKGKVSIERLSDTKDKIPWRDHWMQAIYYLPEEISIILGNPINLIGSHDEYSFWFQVTTDLSNKLEKSPACTCSVHLAYPRSRIGQLNDKEKNDKYINVIRKHITSDTVCLSLSDGSLLGLIPAILGANKLIVFEPNYLSRKSLENFVQFNSLTNKVKIINSIDELNILNKVKPSLIIGEPYFINSIYPWDNLRFWYLASKYAPNVPTIPMSARIRGVAVEFKDLHKIRAPLGICEEFDLTIFDEILSKSSNISDNPIETHPLWEYPAKALTEPFDLTSMDFCESFNDTKETILSGQTSMLTTGSCNGIALWIDWYLDSETIISTGPTSQIQPGKRISWELNTRQGVFLFRKIENVTKKDILLWSLKYHFGKDRYLDFTFNLKNNI